MKATSQKAKGVMALVAFWLMFSAVVGYIQTDIGKGSWLVNTAESAAFYAIFGCICALGWYGLNQFVK